MKPVKQTIFDNENGNCMQACIASLLEMELVQVPNFVYSGKKWWTAFREWIASLGYSPLEVNWPIPLSDEGQHIFPNEGQVCWAVGNSPRGDWKHAILVKYIKGEWTNYHDPHPSDDFLDGDPELVGMLIRLSGK